MQGRYRGLEDGRGYTPNPNPNSSFRSFGNRTSTGYNRSSNFNRRPYLPPPPPSKHEILMRAGKLAAEYLVSQGLLDPEKLPHNRGRNGKLKEFEGLKYGKEDDGSGNEADYGPGEYYRERESGFDQLPARSENTMESRSENQDLAEDGGSKTSSLSLKKDASNEMVVDNVVASEVSKEVQSDADYDSKKETTMEDNTNGEGDDDVMKAIAQENINIELKEEEKEIDGEEKSINKRKREDDELPISDVKAKELSLDEEIDGEGNCINKRKREDDELPIRNVKVKESSLDEEIEAPLEIAEEKIVDEIDGKIEEEEKQVSSEPFKACDLDLMHGNEVVESDKGNEVSVNIELDAENGNGSGEFDEISTEPFKACDLDLIHGNEVVESDKGNEVSVNIELDAKNGNGSGEFDEISTEPFKACDLDLMHGNEVVESDKGNEVSVNIELDAENGNGSCEFDEISKDDDDKAVQTSNMEIDVAMDGSRFYPPNPGEEDTAREEDTIREEPIYPNLDSFLNQHEHADLNCIHDGYSLDFPNFLGSDITGCPSVPTDLNNLGSEMEGLPNDDDSIYVSLGEIPIGFMEVWDPPGQDYGKFF